MSLINFIMAKSNVNSKRSLDEVSQSSEEDEQPSKLLVTSSSQEEQPTGSGVASSGEAMEEEFQGVVHRKPFGRLHGSPRSSISEVTRETHPSDVTTKGALGGSERSNRSSTHTKDPSVPPPDRKVKERVEAGSSVPSAAVPSAPPPRTVKGGEKAGSSGPSGDRKSAVSNKKKTSISVITGPNTNKWKN